MTRQPNPTRILAVGIVAAALLLPAAAAAERVVTRKGEVIVGTPRFEDDSVVVVREDGSEVRIPRTQVERIELTDAEANPEVAPPAGAPESQAAPPPEQAAPPAAQTAPPPEQAAPPPVRPGPQPWRRRPPPPPTPPPGAYRAPYTPPPPTPVFRARAYDQNGFALTMGYHRGLALGGEYQIRTGKNFGFGFGGQLGFEPVESRDNRFDRGGSADAYGTYGLTARAYAGRVHRLALELGFGLNAIDPDLAPNCAFDDRDCAERNHGPEFSVGYQFISDSGFLFETLFGAAVITNERYADAHGRLNPLFQLSFGYLFH